MRIVVQRVSSCRVSDLDSDKVIGKIEKGLFILLGVAKDDSIKDADIWAEKVSKLRVMSDKEGKMNLSVEETKSEILVISQFTLLADTKGGNRPSFVNAEEPEKAMKIYEYFINQLKSFGLKVKSGKFGAYMQIDAVLDGPVTIIYE